MTIPEVRERFPNVPDTQYLLSLSGSADQAVHEHSHRVHLIRDPQTRDPGQHGSLTAGLSELQDEGGPAGQGGDQGREDPQEGETHHQPRVC